MPRLASQDGTDLDPFDAQVLELLGDLLGDLFVHVDDQLPGVGIGHSLEGHAADDAVDERLDDLAVLDDGRDVDPFQRATVELVDDDLLADVDELPRQVARVGRLEGRVGQPLAGAVRRDEVLEDVQALPEVGDDRGLQDLARGLGHEAAHPGQLADLLLVPSGPGVGHDVQGVELLALEADLAHLFDHGAGDPVRGRAPDLDDPVEPLAGGDRAVPIEVLDGLDLFLGLIDERPLLLGDDEVVDAQREPGLRGVGEAEFLHGVEDPDRGLEADLEVGVEDEVLQALLPERAVDVGKALGQDIVEDDPARRRLVELVLVVLDRAGHDALIVIIGRQVHEGTAEAQVDDGLERDLAVLHGQKGLIGRAEDPPLPFQALLFQAQVVAAEDHVLAGDGQGPAVGGREDVIRRQHQGLGLDLGLDRKRDVNGHLVAVEVGIEGGANERVDLDGLALDEEGLEGLDPKTVKRGRAVEEDRVFADNLLEVVPHLGPLLLVPLPGHLDARDEALFLQLIENERFEELKGHFLGQPALVQLEFGADNDDRPARVVDALAEEVLAEAALFAAQGLAQGLEGPTVGAEVDAATFAVVEKGVDGLLEHPLLVADDEFGGLELHELLEPVVAVDDPAVEVVEIGGGEAAAVEADERAKVGRDDRDDIEDHPFRPVPGPLEGLEDAQALGVAELALLGRLLLHQLAEPVGLLLDVDLHEEDLDGLGPDGDLELVAILFLGVLELLFVEELLFLERRVGGVDDDVGLEIEDLLQVLDGQVEDEPDAAGRALEKPDMGDGRSQLNMAHALPPDLGLGDLDTAALADDAAVLHPLVLAAEALIVVDRAEDLGAEQAVLLGLERPVVDGLGLGHLAPGPALDLVRRGDADADPVEFEPRPRNGRHRGPDVH
jgi:hypothetical protein